MLPVFALDSILKSIPAFQAPLLENSLLTVVVSFLSNILFLANFFISPNIPRKLDKA